MLARQTAEHGLRIASSWILGPDSWLLGLGFRARIDVLEPILYKIRNVSARRNFHFSRQ
jgi:hypothetical protein